MGKVRELRTRVHSSAVRPSEEAALGPAPSPQGPSPPHLSSGGARGKDGASVGTNIFAGTKIDLSALEQKLDLVTRTLASFKRGAETKSLLPKKEKLKLRHERWLQKAIKLAERKRLEAQRRRATEVVGDLRPLMEALPELAELENGGKSRQLRSRVTSKPRPTELSRMNAAQRLQLLEEERARFQALLANPTYQASPLQAIGQQLAHQMRLEGCGRL
ncbi:ribosome biogenesis protein SLX9 homolog isoform 2-T2 [Trichechus inunguis]|uniref:Ribosome biogenesis protein SLX9 homolog isoform X2 n=1 Tax=Trichechus manatus latirostris TaxID=127582 RepID=A0A2Y9RMG1_TRIMA|nr:ribosome biogenesis protein SLX9 homolog isoform X2 [Trichechus manatus latirostris]